MSVLDALPVEVLERILIVAEPVAVARFSQTCHAYYSLIYNALDQRLWRSLFLAQCFDDPRECLTHTGQPLASVDRPFDWKNGVQNRVRVQKAISGTSSYEGDELTDVLITIIDMINYTPPTAETYEKSRVSKNLVWLAMHRNLGWFIDNIDQKHLRTSEQRQLIAHLHTLYGSTDLDQTARSLVMSRALVYNMRNYNAVTEWGPFIFNSKKREIQVNWHHVLAIQHIMSSHVVLPNWNTQNGIRITPMSLPFCQAQLVNNPDAEFGKDDWVGIIGMWRCSFAFVEHILLIALNSPNLSADESVDKTILEDPDFSEIHNIIDVEMRITSVVPNPDIPTRPTLKFIGVINGGRTMVGEVYMTPDHIIRWEFASDMYSSEGVQIGAAQSGFGVLGTWSTVFHDEHDPIGPFWLHKVHNHRAESEE